MCRSIFALSLLLTAALPIRALAEEKPLPPVDCRAVAVLPVAFTAWASAHVPIEAAGNAKSAPIVAIGKPVDAGLVPMVQVKAAAPPSNRPNATGSGGFLAFETQAPGTWRIALSGRAWVDVIAAGKSVASVAHGHGPQCSGIAKYVDFTLPAGRHLIQLSESPSARIGVMITPAG